MEEMHDDIERAVGRAIQTVKDESPGEPSAQPQVVLEIAELEFRKMTEDDHWEWDEVQSLLKREIERRT